MTLRQAEALEAVAEEAEVLAEVLEAHPILDEPETVDALLELADHHHHIAPEVARVPLDSTETAVVEGFLVADATNLAALEERLVEADLDAARAARHYRHDRVLAIVATGVMLATTGVIGWLVVVAGPEVW